MTPASRPLDASLKLSQNAFFKKSWRSFFANHPFADQSSAAFSQGIHALHEMR
jgi:hypothetical protein